MLKYKIPQIVTLIRFGDLFGDMACFFPSVFSFG